MKPKLLPFQRLSEESYQDLQKRLHCFYATADQYSAFRSPSDQHNCWIHIISHIQEKICTKQSTKLKVLEIGAGKTGFGRYLRLHQLRHRVEFHVQDVTRFNEDWLKIEADACFFGDILSTSLPHEYDIIFSTYVLEHVANPAAHLNQIWKLLGKANGGGDFFIFSPRYDLPGYLCPSARHLPITLKFWFCIVAMWARIMTKLFKRPQFLIQTDLAVFHRPFFLDADAVHWVSISDLKMWAIAQRASFRNLRIGCPPILSKDWLIKRWCTTALHIQKA